MPIGPQSLQFYTSTQYTSMVASAYKANLDSNSAIASNPAGSLYVYPNNPVGLSVLVDDGFNLPQTGMTASTLFNGASSPNVVTLVAPGSNSYYGCVYWDLSNSTSGVIYGVTSATPTPVVPDQMWRLPLAQVLLTTGQSTVTAANIFDVRTFGGNQAPSTVVSKSLGSVATNQVVNCMGADKIYVNLAITATVGLTLSNLRYGAYVGIFVASTGTFSFIMAATSPSGTAYTTIQAFPSTGAATNLLTGVALTSAMAAALSTAFHGVSTLQFTMN